MTVQDAYYGSAATATLSGIVGAICLFILVTYSPTILKIAALVLGSASMIGFGMSVAVAMDALDKVAVAKKALARSIENHVEGVDAKVVAHGMDEDMIMVTRSKTDQVVVVLPFDDARVSRIVTRNAVLRTPTTVDALYGMIRRESL